VKTLENIKACARFLGELLKLGVPPDSIGTMEAAYWLLLKYQTPSSLDSTSPFVGAHEIDVARVCAALEELMGDVRLDAAQAELIGFCQFASEAQWAGGIEARLQNGTPDGPSLGAMCRAAIYVALALRTGASVSEVSKLRRLVFEEIAPQSTKTLSAPPHRSTGDKIRRALGISEATWAQHSRESGPN
jgi:hypothetical protein